MRISIFPAVGSPLTKGFYRTIISSKRDTSSGHSYHLNFIVFFFWISMASTTLDFITVDDDDDVSPFQFSLLSIYFYFLIYKNPFLISLQEFDWEAACREIDEACQNSKPSVSCSDNDKPKLCKQSTLDRFISHAAAVPPLENGDTAVRDESNLDCEEGLRCFDIDPEAAKTWIYPGSVYSQSMVFFFLFRVIWTN